MHRGFFYYRFGSLIYAPVFAGCSYIPRENEHPERTGRNFKGHSEEHPLWSSLISRPSASPRGPFGNFLGLQPPGRQKQKFGDGSPKRGGRFVQQSGHRRAPLPEGTGPAEKPAATQERPKGDPGATRALDLPGAREIPGMHQGFF